MAKIALSCGLVCSLILLALPPADGQLEPGAAGDPTSETRSGGIRKIVVEFDQPVQAADGALDPTDVVVKDSETPPNYYTPTSVVLEDPFTELVILFDSGVLPDEKRYTFSLADKFKSRATGQLLGGDTDCDVRGLVGDVNQSGSVTGADMDYIRRKVGLPVDEATARFDVNLSGGIITGADMDLTRRKVGNTAP